MGGTETKPTRVPFFNPNTIPGRFTADIIAGRKPPIAIQTARLEYAVAWSDAQNRPITLREFIAAQAHDSARTLGIEPQLAGRSPIPIVDDLTEEQLRKVTIARLRGNIDDTALQSPGEFSVADLIREVEAESPTGYSKMDMIRHDIAELEAYALHDKLVLVAPRT